MCTIVLRNGAQKSNDSHFMAITRFPDTQKTYCVCLYGTRKILKHIFYLVVSIRPPTVWGLFGTLSESHHSFAAMVHPRILWGSHQPPGPRAASAALCCFLSSKNGYAQVVVRVILAAGAVSTLGAMLHVISCYGDLQFQLP